MKRILAALLLLAAPAIAGPYYTYPTAGPLNGTEIIGPIRQNGQDVSATLSQILALQPTYPAAAALTGSEIFSNVQQSGISVDVTAAAFAAYAQKIQAAGLSDNNTIGQSGLSGATGCVLSIVQYTHTVGCLQRDAGGLAQGYPNHQVFHIPLAGNTLTGGANPGLSQDLTQGVGYNSMPALIPPMIQSAVGVVDCWDNGADYVTWQFSAHWTAFAGATVATPQTIATTVLFSAGTITGWNLQAGNLNLVPYVEMFGATTVSCTGHADINQLTYP